LELGLATQLAADPLTAARQLAREIAASSPDAVRAAKRLINVGMTGASEREILLAEAIEQQALLASTNHREALLAHAEQRLPVYRD
jgi:enoyl-CoA hydratase/carnithine racemase